MGAPAIIDRFKQIDPKVLIAADGVLYAGRRVDRAKVIEALRGALPNLAAVVLHRTGFSEADTPYDVDLREAMMANPEAEDGFEPEWLPFDQPLWVVYTSGTTGMPKPIVHGHGGVLLAAAAGGKNMDLAPSYEQQQLRRALSLVQHLRLDHVERPGQRPAQRRDDLSLRREPERAEGGAGFRNALSFRCSPSRELSGSGRGFL